MNLWDKILVQFYILYIKMKNILVFFKRGFKPTIGQSVIIIGGRYDKEVFSLSSMNEYDSKGQIFSLYNRNGTHLRKYRDDFKIIKSFKNLKIAATHHYTWWKQYWYKIEVDKFIEKRREKRK